MLPYIRLLCWGFVLVSVASIAVRPASHSEAPQVQPAPASPSAPVAGVSTGAWFPHPTRITRISRKAGGQSAPRALASFEKRIKRI